MCARLQSAGDLHKLCAQASKAVQLEYGYSCMGFGIAGGLGVKMADSEPRVYVLVGGRLVSDDVVEIITSIQEADKLTTS